LITLKPYRHIIAAVHLGLYSFFITPVQLWHHHSNADDKIAIPKPISGQKVVLKGTGISNNSFCSICNHKYSIFLDDALSHPYVAVVLHSILFIGYHKFYVSPIVCHLANKGPPSIF